MTNCSSAIIARTGEAQPIVSARDGLENLRITEAIVEASRTGSIVETVAA